MGKPNVLVLMCDQMQHDRMGFVNGRSHTPNLDRLADEGVHFSHAFTQHGQCMPARAVFMTGQPAHQCGVMINYGYFGHHGMLTESHRTLPRQFNRAGYRTVYFGKAHLGEPVDSVLETVGFQEGKAHDDDELPDNAATQRGIGYVPLRHRREYLTVERARKYLEQYEPDDRPLFFMFSTNLPHPPFYSERDYAHLFAPEEMPLPVSYHEETFAGKPDFVESHARGKDGRVGSAEEVRAEIANYESMIAKMDEMFGTIIDQFQAKGLWENTIVLFLADHGDMMGAHRMRKKGPLPYDEVYRIPCICRLPKGWDSARKTVDDMICLDSCPGTLLKLAGLPVPDSFTGGDICDVFNRSEHPDDEALFYEHYGAYWGIRPLRAIRTRKHKLIRYYRDDILEFYDLEADPHELNGQTEVGYHGEIIHNLSERLEAWWQRTDGEDFDYYQSDAFRSNAHNERQDE
jgi:choline-sulfatase